jgi:hypothetical protein
MLNKLYHAAAYAVARFERRRPVGRSIWEENWDLCIVLDSARADMLYGAVHQFFSAEKGTAWSVGSVTTEWIANTFHERHCDELDNVAYVTANPHSSTVFDDGQYLTNPNTSPVSYPDAPVVKRDALDGVHEVWRAHATRQGAVGPQTMHDATIEAMRRYDRVVAHWLQPHEPFIARTAPVTGGTVLEGDVWAAMQRGDVEPSKVWESYEANLLYALTKVEQLLDRVNGRVLVTADHGNAFGDWGVYGHPFGWPEPAVRRVPWVLVHATTTDGYKPDAVLDTHDEAAAMQDQLSALGYL